MWSIEPSSNEIKYRGMAVLLVSSDHESRLRRRMIETCGYGVRSSCTVVRHPGMRLWSVHPKYLDAQGLVALWREALLARAVLRGETRGYTRHPQLERFSTHANPRLAINSYLAVVHAEATRRRFSFDRSKVGPVRPIACIAVSSGQIAYEWAHLLQKLAARNPALFIQWSSVTTPACHPLFRCRSGPLASWERASDGASSAKSMGTRLADPPSEMADSYQRPSSAGSRG
jgi:hypothetical protein